MAEPVPGQVCVCGHMSGDHRAGAWRCQGPAYGGRWTNPPRQCRCVSFKLTPHAKLLQEASNG